MEIWYDERDGCWYGKDWVNGEHIYVEGSTKEDVEKALRG